LEDSEKPCIKESRIRQSYGFRYSLGAFRQAIADFEPQKSRSFLICFIAKAQALTKDDKSGNDTVIFSCLEWVLLLEIFSLIE